MEFFLKLKDLFHISIQSPRVHWKWEAHDKSKNPLKVDGVVRND